MSRSVQTSGNAIGKGSAGVQSYNCVLTLSLAMYPAVKWRPGSDWLGMGM